MPERLSPGPVRGNPCVKEAVCVHTRKVYDSCRDKECIQDMRVYLTEPSQAVLATATSVRPGGAQLIWVYVDVDAVPFNKGFYTVDAVYFYRITAEVFTGVGKPTTIEGVASYSKRVILYGSEGKLRTFLSTYNPDPDDTRSPENFTMPIGVVEAVEPILLSVKTLENSQMPSCPICELGEVPEAVLSAFDAPLVLESGGRTLYVTIGQFSVVKLEREVQMLMPVYDNCIPDKQCDSASSEDPCEVFERFRFPVEEFAPPDLERCRD
ncbi:MAG: hypothetical protein E7458_05305 [Ruminococcaceae bacterium]|nr:hypothetical protein [Oscillospiraceae bacterium]